MVIYYTYCYFVVVCRVFFVKKFLVPNQKLVSTFFFIEN